MKREQMRALEEMKDRHQKEEHKLKKNLEVETREAEAGEEARFKSEKEKQVFELQQRQAADRQARQDLDPAEMERVSRFLTYTFFYSRNTVFTEHNYSTYFLLFLLQ